MGSDCINRLLLLLLISIRLVYQSYQMPKKYTNCNSTLICLHSPFAIRQKDLVYTQKTLRKGKAN